MLRKVVEDREQVIIKRRGEENVVLAAEDDLTSMAKTAYLLRSPRNAARLLAAFECPQSVDDLRRKLA